MKSFTYFYLRAKYHLFQRRRHNRLVLEKVAGQPLVVLPGVMNPKLFVTGEFLAESLNPELVPPNSKVLDMGTGSGIGALFAAKWAAKVVAVDVNPSAVQCARINALLHQLDHKIDVLEGNLFAPVHHETFDVILFNPPYLQGEPTDLFDHAMFGEPILVAFCSKLQSHLRPDGHALVTLSNKANLNAITEMFRQRGSRMELISQRRCVGEMLYLYRITFEESTGKSRPDETRLGRLQKNMIDLKASE